MVKDALLEMTLFDSTKQTEKKLRWDANVEGVGFALYIPKWRVPQPWPSRIWVGVTPRRKSCEDPPNLSRQDVEADSTLTHEPLVATVAWREEHTRTIRYTPVGVDSECWEIGEPYVPIPLTWGGAERLRVIVLWDFTSRGCFEDRVGAGI